MRVIGERLDDVGTRVDEVAMELRHDLGVLEHDLGHERAGLQVATALELEHVAFGADHGPLVEAFEEGESGRCRSHGAMYRWSNGRLANISRLAKRGQRTGAPGCAAGVRLSISGRAELQRAHASS